MKKRLNKLEKSQYIFIILFILSGFFLIINFIPIFVINAGITTDFTGDFNNDRVAHVNQSNPDMNYADYHWGHAFIGNSCETFVHFNLNLLPKETEELYIILRGYSWTPISVDPYTIEDIELNVILVESNWSSSEITWNNKPRHKEIIDTVNASEIFHSFFLEYYDLGKALDLTEIFKDNQLDEISLCINITENNAQLNGCVCLSGFDLLWNYEKVILSYTNIISASVILSILVGTIYFLRKEIYTCTNCGTKKVHIELICPKCDSVFDDDRLIKRSDYQLILILLWTFIFFEVLYLIIIALINWLFYYLLFISSLLAVIWIIIYYIIIKKKIKLYKNLKV